MQRCQRLACRLLKKSCRCGKCRFRQTPYIIFQLSEPSRQAQPKASTCGISCAFIEIANLHLEAQVLQRTCLILVPNTLRAQPFRSMDSAAKMSAKPLVCIHTLPLGQIIGGNTRPKAITWQSLGKRRFRHGHRLVRDRHFTPLQMRVTRQPAC